MTIISTLIVVLFGAIFCGAVALAISLTKRRPKGRARPILYGVAIVAAIIALFNIFAVTVGFQSLCPRQRPSARNPDKSHLLELYRQDRNKETPPPSSNSLTATSPTVTTLKPQNGSAWPQRKETPSVKANSASSMLWDEASNRTMSKQQNGSGKRLSKETSPLNSSLAYSMTSEEGRAAERRRSCKVVARGRATGPPVGSGELGTLYLRGLGVTQNFEEAYFWLILGSTSGQKDFSAERDKVAALLTPQQVSAVQKRAAECS